MFCLTIINIMLGKLTSDIVEKLVVEFKKEKNRKKLEDNIVDPLVCYMLDRIYPYIFVTAIIFVLLLLIVVVILVILLRQK